MLSGNIENVSIKEKAKFPQEFFPDVSISCNFIDSYIFLLYHLSHDSIVWHFLCYFSSNGQEKASLELGGIYAIGMCRI